MTRGSGWKDSDLSHLRLEALDHLNNLLSGEADDRDAAKVIAWRAQSGAHEEAFRAALRLRNLVRQAEAVAVAPPQDVQGPAARVAGDSVVLPFPAGPRTALLSRRRVLGGAIAASVAAGAVVAGRSLDLVPSPGEALATYRTGPGERRTLALAQGAMAELNTRTSVDLHAGMAVPAIDLIAGEAVLTSGRIGAALVAGEGVSIVRGGRLNARREGGQTCITCLAGTVEVAWNQVRRTLRAAEEIRYSHAAIGAVISGVDAVARTAWQTGTLIFRDMPMREVVHEINRYRPGKVLLTNNALAERRLSGTYHVRNLDDFFSQAQLALGVRITRLPGNVVILS